MAEKYEHPVGLFFVTYHFLREFLSRETGLLRCRNSSRGIVMATGNPTVVAVLGSFNSLASRQQAPL